MIGNLFSKKLKSVVREMFGKEKNVTDLRPNDEKTSPRKSAKQNRAARL